MTGDASESLKIALPTSTLPPGMGGVEVGGTTSRPASRGGVTDSFSSFPRPAMARSCAPAGRFPMKRCPFRPRSGRAALVAVSPPGAVRPILCPTAAGISLSFLALHRRMGAVLEHHLRAFGHPHVKEHGDTGGPTRRRSVNQPRTDVHHRGYLGRAARYSYSLAAPG